MDNSKEGFFGGLPEDLFNHIVTFLQNLINAGGAPAGPAVSVLVSLAQSEHAAAVSTFKFREMDAIFKAIDLQNELLVLEKTPTGALPGALGTYKGKLDKMRDFWLGK
jgi:hypothetical protein